MLRFDRVGVDVAARIVELDGAPQHLEPQAFDLLAYLITHRHRVVPKAELLDEVWGDQFVSESALTTRIKEVRRAVGDDGTSQAVVRNFRGRGYRFVAEPGDGGSGPDHQGDALPVVVTGLRGRAAEIAEVAGLLDRSAVVTLTGPGGVGKTALALEVARHVGRRHVDGVAVIRLAPVSEPSGVVHVLRRTTGLSDAGPAEADLVAAVADLDALLVVDNCEHVIDEAARLIDAIAAEGGTARILATSRERLGIRSEQVRPIRPLDLAPARELLLERARSLRPDWSADDSNLDRLVHLVDRLPLAIEMAAARLPVVGVDELIELLEDRLDLLRSPDRTAEDRHSTLLALIAWSENLLDPDARRLLTDLAVFAGPVGVADIAPVVDADPAELVVGPLADLVEHSLVVADTVHQPTRYHLLETVKACITGRRDRSVDERHARHIAESLQATDRALRTPDEPAAVDRFESLTAEIRAAHRWACANDAARAAAITTSLLHYAHERQWTEPAGWSRQLLEVLEAGSEHAAPPAALLAADASNLGAYDRATALARLAIDSPDPIVASSAHDTLANVGLYTGDLDLARRHSAELVDLAERTADPTIWTLGQLDDVLSLLYSGEVDQARRRLDERKPPASLSPTCSAWLAYAEGEVHAARGRTAEAIDRFDAAIELATPVRSPFVISVATVSALAARSRAGDIDEAMSAFAPVLAHYRRIRSLTHGVTALRNLIGLLVRCGRDEPAAVLLGTLSGPDTKSTYGTESELLTEARRTLRARNPVDAVASWTEHGEARDAIWALDYAIALLPDT